jgi:hypothetical protein
MQLVLQSLIDLDVTRSIGAGRYQGPKVVAKAMVIPAPTRVPVNSRLHRAADVLTLDERHLPTSRRHRARWGTGRRPCTVAPCWGVDRDADEGGWMSRTMILTALSLIVGVAGVPALAMHFAQDEPQRHSSRAPAAGGYFALSAPGAALPSDRACAGRVRRSAWEPRPGNYRANHRTPGPLTLRRHPAFDARWNARYRPRITGRFVGTTDEIIQWAACKWGLSDELLRAQAAVESGWHQSASGDLEPRSEGNCAGGDRGDPCPTSFGLLQNKWYFNRAGYPMLRTMTSFHLDWSAAQLRGCYDGRKGYPRGDIWACLGNWYSGAWNDERALEYIGRVRERVAAKPWLGWRDRGDSVPYATALHSTAEPQPPVTRAARSAAASPPGTPRSKAR